MTNYQKKPEFAEVTLVLPGPDRKRQPLPYHYRITFRTPDPLEPGCVATWEVYGGREEYQLSLERTRGGELRWHCSCPDAVYRSEDNPLHDCKHVRALKDLFALVTPPPASEPQPQVVETPPEPVRAAA
jgi:hypothetical protein